MYADAKAAMERLPQILIQQTGMLPPGSEWRKSWDNGYSLYVVGMGHVANVTFRSSNKGFEGRYYGDESERIMTMVLDDEGIEVAYGPAQYVMVQMEQHHLMVHEAARVQSALLRVKGYDEDKAVK